MPSYGGEKTFDANYTLSLDEIDLFGFNSVIRIKQEVDSKQLTDEAYTRLSKLYVESKNIMPAREDFPPVNNTIRYASRIHNEGWIVFSIKTEEISLESQINFKSRIIEIQK